MTISPRFVLVNKTKSSLKLHVGQYDRQDHFKTHHGHTSIDFENQKPFHWSDRRETKKITVMLKNMEAAESNDMTLWSKPFQIDEIGQYRVDFPSDSFLSESKESLRVEVKSTDSSIVVIFSITSKDLTPLEVEQQRKMSQVMRRSSVNSNEQEVHFNLLLAMIEISIVDHRRTEILFSSNNRNRSEFCFVVIGEYQ